MPNNTTNILILQGEQESLNDICNKAFVKDPEMLDEMMFDFNAFIPMSKDLDIPSGSVGEEAYACLHSNNDEDWQRYLEFGWVQEEGICTKDELTNFLEERSKKFCKEGEMSWRELGNRYAENLKKYGAKTWYEWCTKNWGTKWNSYNAQIVFARANKVRIEFQTAWTPPIPVYRAISEQYSNVEIEALWFDEGEDAEDAEVVFYSKKSK